MQCGITGLDKGVFHKGQSGLFCLGHAKLPLGYDLNLLLCQKLVNLSDLARVVAGKYDAFAPVDVGHWCLDYL